jgi:two-component system chemotaxis response regulator CheB
MSKIRVMLVDDAVVFRRLIADELSRDPALEVVGTAVNGRIALTKMEQLSPDVVILDVEMPEMDGLATLKELRKTYPRLPVIMFSALTVRGAEATLDALALGATDYFSKPDNAGGLDASLELIREQLISKIKALCARKGTGSRNIKRENGISIPWPAVPTSTSALRGPSAPVHVLAIGASTGGPNALAEIFSQLPGDFPVPIVIVQHMPAMFTRLLAERLSAQCPIPIEEASSGTILEAGRGWIAPGNFHVIITGDRQHARLQLHQHPPENSCRPAVDVLLRSLALTFGPHSLSVILTGMGQDGLRGCELVHDAGGQILVQDEATSVVWGMPGCVARAGLADRVLPVSLIGDEILRRVRHHQVTT